MLVYWREQCGYCKNRQNCEYREKTEEYIRTLYTFDRDIAYLYGTLQWWCNWFNCDEEVVKRNTESVMEVIG